MKRWREDASEPQEGKRPRSIGERAYGRLRMEPIAAEDGDWMVELDCFSADWFDGLRDDLADLPDWGGVARTARTRLVQLTLPRSSLLELLTAVFGPLADPMDAVGRWVQVWLRSDRMDPNALPARIFLPPEGSDDPAQVGFDGREVEHASVSGMAAVPSPSAGATKLDRLVVLAGGRDPQDEG